MSPEERARYIRELVDTFPPLTDEQLGFVAAMMRPGLEQRGKVRNRQEGSRKGLRGAA